MSQAKLSAARELILDGQYATARAVLRTMPESPNASRWLAKLDEIAPEQEEEDEMANWEYRELIVRTPERRLLDIQTMMNDTQNDLSTVDDFFIRTLNDYGVEGWELVSERQQGDHTRLLFKRRMR